MVPEIRDVLITQRAQFDSLGVLTKLSYYSGRLIGYMDQMELFGRVVAERRGDFYEVYDEWLGNCSKINGPVSEEERLNAQREVGRYSSLEDAERAMFNHIKIETKATGFDKGFQPNIINKTSSLAVQPEPLSA